jgi:hypothetical protein
MTKCSRLLLVVLCALGATITASARLAAQQLTEQREAKRKAMQLLTSARLAARLASAAV